MKPSRTNIMVSSFVGILAFVGFAAYHYSSTSVPEVPAVTIQDHVVPTMAPLHSATMPCTRTMGDQKSSSCAVPSSVCNLEVQVIRAKNITVLIDKCGFGHIYQNAVTIEAK